MLRKQISEIEKKGFWDRWGQRSFYFRNNGQKEEIIFKLRPKVKEGASYELEEECSKKSLQGRRNSVCKGPKVEKVWPWMVSGSSPSPAFSREWESSSRSREPHRSNQIKAMRWRGFITSISILHVVYEVRVTGMRSRPPRLAGHPISPADSTPLKVGTMRMWSTQGPMYLQLKDGSRQRSLPGKPGWSHLYGKHYQSEGLELGKFLGDQERIQVIIFDFRSFGCRSGIHILGGIRPTQFPDQVLDKRAHIFPGFQILPWAIVGTLSRFNLCRETHKPVSVHLLPSPRTTQLLFPGDVPNATEP